MNLFRISAIFLIGIVLSYQIIPAHSSAQIISSPKPVEHLKIIDDRLLKDPIAEKDEMLSIILSEVSKRVSSSNFNRGMDDFINWIDGIITRTKHHHPHVKKATDPTEMILEIILESSYKEDLVKTLTELKFSLIHAKNHTLFLPQIEVFQSLTGDGKLEFEAGSRVEDRLEELPRDKRKLDKISINPDHLKILLIQRLTQSAGMGRDRPSTLSDNKRVLEQFKNRLPSTLALRNFIDTLLVNLDKKANEQPASSIILVKIIDFMSPFSQAKFKSALKGDLKTMQNQWDEITQIEPSNVMPLWIDPEEIERQRLFDEAENKRKEAEEERRQKIAETERKKKEIEAKEEAEEAKQEAEAKKSKIVQTRDRLTAEAKEKTKAKIEKTAEDVSHKLLDSVLGEGKGSDNPLGGLLGGLGF